MDISSGQRSSGTSTTPASQTTRTLTIALLGNPNTGKTTLFNALSGLWHRTGNYPGVTVETKKGRMLVDGRVIDLIDLPGVYSLAPRSPDEMVTVDIVLGNQPSEPLPDVVLCIVDASNLERNLYLTSQAMELGLPVVVALNMIDVAQMRGITIDAERLQEQLGCPVVPIQANKRKGIDQLKHTLLEAVGKPCEKHVAFPDAFDAEVETLQQFVGEETPRFLVRRLILDVGGFAEERYCRKTNVSLRERLQEIRQRLADKNCGVPGIEPRTRYAWIRQATTGCIQRPDKRKITWSDRLDYVLTHRVWGSLIFFGVMFVVFQSIFTWAAPLMDLVDSLKTMAQVFFAGILPAGPFASLINDGILEGVGGVLIFLPQILILFVFIAVLEDCGYMARAAFVMDKVMSKCGLSGKSFIPMLSSVACAIPGVMAARVIENQRDRLTTILVAPLMSCSARLPVYVLLIGAFLTTGYPWWVPGLAMFGMYALGIVIAPMVAFALKRTILKGETPVFVMEMPSYKIPSLNLVSRRVLESGWEFVRRAGTIILASMVLVWALLYFPNGPEYQQVLDETKMTIKKIKQTRSTMVKNNEPKKEIAAVESQLAKQKAHAADIKSDWTKESYLGWMGQWIEPAVRPLGWDWRVGVAVLASFPAREVVVGTLGIIYRQGKIDASEIAESEDVAKTGLGKALQSATWDGTGRKVFTIPVAIGLMVFFALCCQCASTLAVIKRETNSWRWPIFTFVYMTALAYIGALLVYQVGHLFA